MRDELPLSLSDMAYRRIGQRLRAQRLSKGFTQADLAKKSGLSLTTIRRSETEFNIGMKEMLCIMEALSLLDSVENWVPEIDITYALAEQAILLKAGGRKRAQKKG